MITTTASDPHQGRYYLFRYATFTCGCAIQISFDDLIICPVHGGMLVETHEIRSAESFQGNTPDIPGLLMNEYFTSKPRVIYNDRTNSIHTITRVQDPSHNDWGTTEEEFGICPACYIDDEQIVTTHVALCECGNVDCEYRWCGRIDGLHALWRFHVNGQCQQKIETLESDIFSYGAYRDYSPELRAVLDEESRSLISAKENLGKAFAAYRAAERAKDEPWHPFLSSYFEGYTELSDESQLGRWATARQNSRDTHLLRYWLAGRYEIPDPRQLALGEGK